MDVDCSLDDNMNPACPPTICPLGQIFALTCGPHVQFGTWTCMCVWLCARCFAVCASTVTTAAGRNLLDGKKHSISLVTRVIQLIFGRYV